MGRKWKMGGEQNSFRLANEDDVEGHKAKLRSTEDDVEGHRARVR